MRGKRAKQLRKIAKKLEDRLEAINALNPKEALYGRFNLYRRLKKEYGRQSGGAA